MLAFFFPFSYESWLSVSFKSVTLSKWKNFNKFEVNWISFLLCCISCKTCIIYHTSLREMFPNWLLWSKSFFPQSNFRKECLQKQVSFQTAEFHWGQITEDCYWDVFISQKIDYTFLSTSYLENECIFQSFMLDSPTV